MMLVYSLSQDEVVPVALTNVRPVDEAEQVKQCHSRNNHQIDLQPELAFGGSIEVEQWVSISVQMSVSINYSSVFAFSTYSSVATCPFAAAS